MKAAPARSLADEGTAFERKLLESARADAIPAAALERLARALSVPSAASVGSSVAASRLARESSSMKLGAWGLLGVAAATAALRWFDPEPVASKPGASERPTPVALEPALLATRATPAASSEEASPVLETPARAEPSALIERSVAPPAARARVSPRRSRTGSQRNTRHETQPSAAEAGGLRAELIAVESIQRALRAGRNNDADRQLADYARRFPRGELALEAELLRVDLELARGELTLARAHARTLLERDGATRYRARLEALTEHAD